MERRYIDIADDVSFIKVSMDEYGKLDFTYAKTCGIVCYWMPELRRWR